MEKLLGEKFPIVDNEDADVDVDRISEKRLEELGESSELRTLLCNRHLRELLLEAERSDNKAVVIGKLMQIPLFAEFADQCLAIVSPDEMEKRNKMTST